MGTRGKFGFYYKGKYYMCYNHYDSYPSYLGVHLILEILKADLDEWTKLLESMKEVSQAVKPTAEDIEKLKKYTDLTVSSCSKQEWFCLLRLTQGSFYHVLQADYMENVTEGDMGEEYVYVLDLDQKEFRAKGYELDVSMKLEKEEMLKYAKEWSKGALNEDYDPEEALAKSREQVNRMLKDWKILRPFGKEEDFQ